MTTRLSILSKSYAIVFLSLLGFFFSTRTAHSQTVLSLTAAIASQTGTVGSYTVPPGGPYKYRLTARGARGGNVGSFAGGQGASMIGEFILLSGQVINAIAGATGEDFITASDNLASGGGGGSGAQLSNGTPLLIAAGGGGAVTRIFGFGTAGGSGLATNSGSQGGSGTRAGAGGGGFASGGGTGVGGATGGGSGFGGLGGDAGNDGRKGGGGFGGGGGGRGGYDYIGGGGGGGYTGGNGSDLAVGGSGGGSINYGTNQTNRAGANNAGGQVLIEIIGPAAAFAPTLSATQPTCGSSTGSLSIDLTGDFNNSTNSVEYAIVAGGSFSGTPAFTTISSEPLAVTSGTGTSAAPGGSTYTVRVRLIYNPTIYFDYTYTLSPSPARLYVKAGASGANTGLNWTDAFTDLQNALKYTNSQCLTEIWVAAGVYKPTSGTDKSISFAMKNGVAIYGGFVGNEQNLTDRPTINPVTGSPSSSTLSGDIGTAGNSSDNSYHIISNSSLNSSAKLDGFTLVGGNDSGFGGGGGAINNSNSSPTLINCSFMGNQAFNGGAINNTGSSVPTLTNSSFTSNTATNGGALFGNATLTNCLFSGNTASQAGGAIYAASSLSVTSCSFQGNQATGNGGGIHNDGSSIPITNSSFTSNTATNGGALFGSGALTNCSFINNTVSQLGGAIYAGSSLSVASCSFQGNQAPNGFGGALVGNATLTNSVFWGNGGSKTLEGGSFSPTYCLLDNLNNVNLSGPGNLTTTSSPFVSTTSVALIACAPAINAGDPATTSATVGNIDLAGNPRFFNNGRIDMGAVEYQGNPFAVSAGASLPQANVGVTLSLTATGATTYQWTAPPTARLTAPANASVTSASLTTAGVQTFTVLGTTGACSQSAIVSVTALAGPDLSAIINLPSGSFATNQTKGMLVQLQEVNGAPATGNVLITITVPTGYSVSFDNSLTSIEVGGGSTSPVQNAKWQISSTVGSQQLSLRLNGGESVGAGSTMNLGILINRTSANGGSYSNITVSVADDSGGTYDVNRLNNIYARIINGI